MPWALFNRPSIQLGALKAYIETRNPDFSVHTSHHFLDVAAALGPDLYHWISQNPWVSEAIYTPLVFPEQADSAGILAVKYVRKAAPEIKSDFHYESLVQTVNKSLLQWIADTDWSRYSLVGFSVCFHQLFASLAAAKAVKEKNPHAIIVFGGSSCAAAAGHSLLKTFHFIDYIIHGEGEKTFLQLCEHISGLHPDPDMKNVNSRKPTNVLNSSHQTVETQLGSLADLPIPDYDDYFSDIGEKFRSAPFIPVLPVEFSRGCWWNKCSFCNLNLQWCGYRYKKAAQMLHEVKTLALKYRCLDFTFVDNMLPPKEVLHFFKKTGEDPSDLGFFAEIRSSQNKNKVAENFSTYRQGGLTTIQVGIESFSNSLLQKMQKGVSAIENIATMREALENNIKLEGNLILQFPGSTRKEVDETLETLEYVFPYPPLAAAAFFLGHDSPVHRDPRKFGIKAIVNHPNNYKLFPKAILPRINLLIKGYRGDQMLPALQKPLLSYRNGDDFLIIRQEFPDGRILHHRLQGTSRRIYLSCTHITSDQELFKEFSTFSPAKIVTFLADLKKKKVLYSENNKYLALAVHFSD